ncbi:MAG: VWA domain-containing protein [Spirochaetota bacterium]|nr:MAG: VWA domain-containing protein [Spirochaetota bacterium]
MKTLNRYGDTAVLERFSRKGLRGNLKAQGIIASAAVLLFLLTLARPQAGTRLEQVSITGSDMYIAIDLSQSMTTEDIEPNRLERAKLDALEIVSSLEGDRVGLILFAGDAYVQCPLTHDYDAASTFIKSLNSEVVGTSGTSLSAPLETSLQTLKSEEDKYALLVLLTDGENTTGDPGKVIKELKRRGIKVFSVGIGTKEGAPIPLYDETGNRVGYKKDKTGKVVISRLRDDILQRISQQTGGRYYEAGARVIETKKILVEVANMKKRDLEVKRFTVWEDRFQIPLGIGILFLLFYIYTSVRGTKLEP